MASGREYFDVVISIARLRRHVSDKWVACDDRGQVLDIEIPRDIGPAALLVTPVTDALKTIDDVGNLIGSVDRSELWAVDAIVLNVVALDRLEDDEVSPEDLLQLVRDSGLAWQVRPTSDP